MYSSPAEIEAFAQEIARLSATGGRPLFVLDMDGNILVGYNLREGQSLPASDNPRQRSIPKGSDTAALLEAGVLEQALFARKPLDSRVPEPLVTRINALEREGRLFEIAILTSRNEADALDVLRESGIRHPERVTLVSDSGAVMRIGGLRHAVRQPDVREQAFLDGIPSLSARLEPVVDAVVAREGFDPSTRPPLRMEAKAIAANIHFREILWHYAQGDESPLAKGLSESLVRELQRHIAAEGEGFTLLYGPATLEVKLPDIDKGRGLAAVTQAALDAGVRPSAIIFAGDDICHRDAAGNAIPGTDYHAFAAAGEVQARTGIPVRTIHTLHPADGSLTGTVPDMAKAPPPDMAKADITVPVPPALVSLIEKVLQRCIASAKGSAMGRA